MKKNNSIYKDLPDNIMDKILDRIRREPWRKVVFEEIFAINEFLYHIMTDTSRSDGQYLLPLGKGMTVADIGAGYGTFAIPLAKRGIKVLAIDPSPKRLEFLKECAIQEGVLKHINLITAYAQELPIKDKKCDAAIMNGVLEWVGEFSKENVLSSQKKALKEVYRILKKSGVFYLGIENREGLKYLLGAPEDHSSIPYISLLSRAEANIVSQSINHKPYKTHTYSKKRYTNLLKGIGFKKTEFYAALPDYKSPKIFFEDDLEIEKYLSTDLYLALAKTKKSEWFMTQNLLEKGLYHQFSNSFVMVSYK